jgi:membrane associated rhomboid family serine protease
MTQFHRSHMFGALQPTGKGTKFLCIALLAVSLIGAITQRKWGVGIHNLRFDVGAVMQLELWRLVTYPFVESSTFGLLMALLVLWLLGNLFEAKWGTRYFVQFFAFACVGAALLAIPLTFLLNFIMPFSDIAVSEGPDAAIDAMLVALALTAPNSNVLFGFLLPMQARTLIYVLLGIEIITGIQSGSAHLSITLGGMLMGYLLVTGNWRPKRLWSALMERLGRKRRSRLYVVPPKGGGREWMLH